MWKLATTAGFALVGLTLAACSDVPGGRFDATAPVFTAENPDSLSVQAHKALDLPQTTTDHQVDLNQLLAFELQRYASSDPVQWTFSPENVPPSGYVVETGREHPTLYIGPSARNLDALIAAVGGNGQKVTIRNDVVSTLVSASRGNCYVYVKSLRADQVGSRLLSDFFAGSLATAGALVPHAQAAHLLAGLSAFSTGEGASIDRNVFAQQAAEAIGDAMLKLQDDDRTKIESNMRQPYAVWPLGLALADVMQFHGDCSVARGLVKMQAALQQREMAVQAVRAAAAQAELNSGSATSLLQVVAAIESPPGSSSTTPPTAASELPSEWSADLVALQNAIVKCMQAEASDIAANPTSKSVAGDTGFLTTAGPSACVAAGPNDWTGMLKTSSDTVNTGTAPTLAVGAAPAAVTQYSKDIAAYFAAAEQTFLTKSTPSITAKAGVRDNLATALQSWTGGGTPTNVVSFIRVFVNLPAAPPAPPAGTTWRNGAVADTEVSSLDPVVMAAIVAANDAQEDATPTAKLAAAEAVRAGAARYDVASNGS